MSSPQPAPAGAVVVLLHGQPGGGVLMRPVAERLDDGLDVVTPDRPGYGANPTPPGDFAHNAAWLRHLLRDDGRVLVIVAHSWATGIALSYAADGDERLRGLVLVNPLGPGAISGLDRVLALRVIGPGVTAATFFAARPLVHWYLARSVDDATATQALRDTMRANRRRGAWRTFVIEQRALVEQLPSVLRRTSAVDAPVVVVTGGRDRVTPSRIAVDLAAQLPDADLVRVDDAGHQLPRTHPGIVAGAVGRLLGLPPATPA